MGGVITDLEQKERQTSPFVMGGAFRSLSVGLKKVFFRSVMGGAITDRQR